MMVAMSTTLTCTMMLNNTRTKKDMRAGSAPHPDNKRAKLAEFPERVRSLRATSRNFSLNASINAAREVSYLNQINTFHFSSHPDFSHTTAFTFMTTSDLPSDRPLKSAKLTHSDTMASSPLRLLVQRHPAHPLAKLPTRGSASAAGYDLYSSESATLPAGGRKLIQTGICLAIPPGHYGRVAPRSGLASKHGIDTGAGVIDEDYRGLLGVLLFNLGDKDFTSKSELHAISRCRLQD